MSAMFTQKRAPVLWLISGVAAAVIFWQWQHPPHTQTVTDKPAPQVPAIAPFTPFQLPPIDQYEEVSARPLFMANRRPEPPPPEEPAAPPPSEKIAAPDVDKKWSLLGVMISPRDTMAVLRPEDAQAKTARVKLGDAVGEWRLESVWPARVVLRKGDKIQELALVRPKKPAGRRPTPKSPSAQAPANHAPTPNK